MKNTEEKLNKVYDKYQAKMKSSGMAFLVEDATGNFKWQRETGDLVDNQPFAIASVTKLYATTIMLKLVDQGQIALDDRLNNYLPASMLAGIHIYKGTDYSNYLTLRHLLTQTSGLPDYFTESTKDQPSTMQRFSQDPVVTFEENLAITKQLKPHFAPDTKGKAYYSDINFDLLEPLIVTLTNASVAENYQKYIFQPLQLQDTYVYTPGMPYDFPGFWMKGQTYKVPNSLGAWPTSGSLISTKTDMMVFLKAFWTGQLFDAKHYPTMKQYNSIQFYPLKYGLGHMRFKSFGAPEIIGHSGSTGVLCYYCPKYDVFITGCTNEVNEAKGIRIVLQLANSFK